MDNQLPPMTSRNIPSKWYNQPWSYNPFEGFEEGEYHITIESYHLEPSVYLPFNLKVEGEWYKLKTVGIRV